MTKQDIERIKKLIKENPYDDFWIDDNNELLFEEIVEELESGGEVSIVGFGKFYLYQHSPRPVRNPKTQEEMILKPYKSVKFKVSDKLKKHFKGVG